MSHNLALFVIFFPVFLFSLSFHECAHAWMANRLGDSTARLLGRMTLNPLAHIDLIGTVLFPLLMFLMPGLVLFGWAKPVPVNPYNLKKGTRDHFRVAAAGPFANLCLALIFTGLLYLLTSFEGSTVIIIQMLETGVYLNLMLALFNLIPLPPLDGAKVLEHFLPARFQNTFYRVEQYSFLILIGAIYLGVFRYLTIPVFKLARLILP